MHRNLYRKKRSYQDTLLPPPSPVVDIKERKAITILNQKDYDDDSSQKKEIFDEETLKMISAIKKQQQGHLFNSNSSSKALNPFFPQSNKALNAPTNFTSFTNPFNNPFAQPWSYNFNFNFDLSQNTNPVFERDDKEQEEPNEDDIGDNNFNPEEEQEIISSKEIDKDTPIVSIANNSVKYANAKVEAFNLYDFLLKKYICKGKGKISLELFTGNSYMGIVAFRSSEGTSLLFQGNIIPEMTSFEESKKDELVIVLNKVFTQKEKKLENSALKMKYSSKEDKDLFIKGFNRLLEDIKRNSVVQKDEDAKANANHEQKQKAIEVIGFEGKDNKESLKQCELNGKDFLSKKSKEKVTPSVIENPFLVFLSSNKNMLDTLLSNNSSELIPKDPIIKENNNHHHHQEDTVQSEKIHISKFIFGSRK